MTASRKGVMSLVTSNLALVAKWLMVTPIAFTVVDGQLAERALEVIILYVCWLLSPRERVRAWIAYSADLDNDAVAASASLLELI